MGDGHRRGDAVPGARAHRDRRDGLEDLHQAALGAEGHLEGEAGLGLGEHLGATVYTRFDRLTIEAEPAAKSAARE